MATNSQLSTTESEKQTKQTRGTDRIIDMEIIWRKGENGGKSAGIKNCKLAGTE